MTSPAMNDRIGDIEIFLHDQPTGRGSLSWFTSRLERLLHVSRHEAGGKFLEEFGAAAEGFGEGNA